MKFKDKMYHILVNRVPGIRERYRRKRSRIKGGGKVFVWLYLFALNISYYIFRYKKLEQSEKYPYYEEKILYSKGSESSLSKRESPEKFARKLGDYDIISFDVFDTLVFRPFSDPTDLFFILGNHLNYLDFKRIRCEMEWRAREKKYRKERHHEVSLDEIYTVLSEETGIDKRRAMEAEIEFEYTYCFSNPYMLKVVNELEKMGKKMIITSDMYLNTKQIKTLLDRCGYPMFSSYYVSCDTKKSKSKGNLFDAVRKREGGDNTYVHVGDNYSADIEQAKKHGVTPFHYVNVNAAGMPFRPEDMSAITGGLYRGIVNAHIHNGLYKFSREYEYGYIYGGIFVAGYCQFIHEYVKSHSIDKILFLARDGDILSKAYEKLYPDEKGKIQYVYWSRLAATKMAASHYKYDYFRRFLYHKVNQKYTLEQIFSAMELEDMLPDMCKRYKMTPKMELTDKNADQVKKYLMQAWKQVLTHYEEQLRAGRQYYQQVLYDCKKAAAVDIGWAGSGAITLDYIVNHIWGIDCDIIGIVAGTNSCHNAEPDASETFLQSGKLVSYLYSQRHNRDIWKLHDPAKGHNLYWEMLLDAPVGSFKGFYLDPKGDCKCECKEANVETNKIEEIQQGILEFVEQFHDKKEILGDLSFISGRDAYAPMVNVQSKGNKNFIESIKGLADNTNVE